MGTSRLQFQVVKEMDRIFGCHAVRENSRPEWLTSSDGQRLELDVFIPSVNIAIEVQGSHHFRFSKHFHRDAEGFQRLLKADKQKQAICRRRGIRLYEIASDSDLCAVAAEVQGIALPPDFKHVEAERRHRESSEQEYADFKAKAFDKRLRIARERLAEEIAKETPETFWYWETARERLYAESQVEKLERQVKQVRLQALRDLRRRNTEGWRSAKAKRANYIPKHLRQNEKNEVAA